MLLAGFFFFFIFPIFLPSAVIRLPLVWPKRKSIQTAGNNYFNEVIIIRRPTRTKPI